MKPGRNLIAAVWLLGALLLPSGLCARAQEPPPDLHMLLNLDLFAENSGNPGDLPPGQNSSLLEQIRTLAALGYLGKNSAAEPSDSNPPPADGPAAFPDYQSPAEQGDQP